MRKILVVSLSIAALMASAIWVPSTDAFDRWSKDRNTDYCAQCHGNFRSDYYTSLKDGTPWGLTLHDGHSDLMLSSDCNTCHGGLGGGKFPVSLGISAGGAGFEPISCVGCHGRNEDAGNDTFSAGRGMGLRQHHDNAGVTPSCVTSGCHTDSTATPVGEGVLPPYYFTPDPDHLYKPTDPCNANWSESVFATIGLDNDGDLDYDGTDMDCAVNVQQLTDNSYPDGGVQIHNGQFVWVGYEGVWRQIFYWNGTSIQQLTNDYAYADNMPQIHNGQVVWEHNDWNDNEIFYWDGTNIQQLTDNSYWDMNPQIHNGQVVWCGSDGSDWEIFYWDGTNGVQQLTNNDYDDYYPQIHNGQVVWHGFDGSDREIFYWDGTNGVQQLTNNSYGDEDPRIHNGQVVWEGTAGGALQIFYWDGTNIQQLTDNTYNDWNPQIHNGQVVWQGYDGSDYEIFFWDGNNVQQLTNNHYDDGDPQIHNGQVVWRSWGDTMDDMEIFYWDDNKIWQLTDNDYYDSVPRIHNGQVVWSGGLGNDAEVYSYPGIDGILGSGGGTVVDWNSNASFSVDAGVLSDDCSVTIDVLDPPPAPPAPGFQGQSTLFVNFTLDPNPSPLPEPGATITLPLDSCVSTGTQINLSKFDPTTDQLVPTGIVGTVEGPVGGCGTVANFSGVRDFSVFVGFSSTEVEIDIKPGSDPNCFNSDEKGVIPLAILGSADFDAATVDPFTVSLDGAEVRVKGKSGNAGSLEDVNGDGVQDLVVQIIDEGGYTPGDSVAFLSGLTFDGITIEGEDSICIVQ